MRYTAKARMLSFNFLTGVAYGLQPIQGLLLAGMVARADNMGRLPGEPSVLLNYLFFPKRPRSDASADDVEALVSTLEAKGVVSWYAVDGERFVEFKEWAKHQPGLKEHNKRSQFPGPDTAGAAPVKGSDPDAPTLDVFETQPAQTLRDKQVNVAPLVAAVAQSMGMSATGAKYDPDLVELFIKRVASDTQDAVKWAKFSKWLWNTGVRHMPTLMTLLYECERRKPENPYAYFAEGGPGRSATAMRAAADAAAAEHEALKKSEREYAAKIMGVTK